MKIRQTLYMLSLLLGSAAIFVSCEKKFEHQFQTNEELSNKASLKLYNATVSSLRTYIFIDNVRITGAVIPYGSVFPSTGYASFLDVGNRTILVKDTLGTSTQPPASFTANLEAGKRYTIFTYDTINAMKYKLVTSTPEVPADTTARLRFANMIFSKATLPNVDVYSVKKKGNIFTNIALAGVTDYLPYASGITDTLYVRATGTTTDLTPLFSITPTLKRSYTVVYRGRYETTTGTVMNRSLASMTDY